MKFAISPCALAIVIFVTVDVSAAPRAGLAATDTDTSDSRGATASPFTIGTLYGVAIPLYKREFFRVSDGVLERIRSDAAEDYFVPAVFVLPSVAVWTGTWTVRTMKQDEGTLKKHSSGQALSPDDYTYSTSGRTLSIILPAGLNLAPTDGTTISVGVGAAFGWSLRSGAEVGIGLAAVWSQVEYLSDQQRRYVGVALPSGVSDQLETRLRPSAVVGLYLTPTF